MQTSKIKGQAADNSPAPSAPVFDFFPQQTPVTPFLHVHESSQKSASVFAILARYGRQ